MTRPPVLTALSILLAAVLFTAGIPEPVNHKKDAAPRRIMVLDGSPVHDVGELWLHVTNWGVFGSRPGSGLPYSNRPSGMWPAGSGIEHVYEGGLWVGAIRDGVPRVSTASVEWEFRPTEDPIDVVYHSSAGATGGNRLPSPAADDDGDGEIDEDPLDGHDNDLDGLFDEDFAAISDQMMSRWYTDDQPEAIQIYPGHNPLHILVRENSYQWEDDEFDDFIGFDYEITNIGTDVLENVYIGVYADLDVGNRLVENYWQDDTSGFRDIPVVCTPYGAVSLSYGYTCDSSGGSCLGVLLLDHTTDPSGQDAPREVGWSAYANFSSSLDYSDPTNDFERYAMMSSGTIQRDAVVPRDYRMLLSVGPFAELIPGQTLTFSLALVGMASANASGNAAMAAIAYRGQWFDVDGDPTTGVDGRETPIPGPVTVVIDSCIDNTPVDWMSQDPIWINDDCAAELLAQQSCGYADESLYRTGIDGKETLVHWWLPGESPVPVFITQFLARANGLAITLDWETYADEPVESIRLFRSVNGGEMLPLREALSPGVRSYTDTDVVPGVRYAYVLEAHAVSGWIGRSIPASATVTLLATTLAQNYPNPFNPETTISFTLAERSRVVLSVYTAGGKFVARLVNDTRDPGVTKVTWDGRDEAGVPVGSGVYFYRLTVDGKSMAKKMVLLK